jgi:GTPase SAR1 family protein
MSLMDKIISGPIRRAKRIGIHGPPAVGKSTLAAQFPRALFLDMEDGTAELDVRRINIASFEQFESVYQTLLVDHAGIEALVLDPIDSFEKFLRVKLCQRYRKAGIEEFAYGKGWTYLVEEFERSLGLLDALISKGINIVVVGHTAVRRVYLPELPDPFDRHELQIYDRNAAHLKQWLDALLFLNWNVRTQESASGRIRGLGGKERVIFTTHSAAFDAKNRVGLPEKLECSFAALAPLFNASPITQKPLEPQPELSAQQRLKEALFGLPEDWITEFLLNRQKIVEGQNILDVPAAYCQTALAQITDFRAAITKFGEDHDDVPVSD